MTKTTTTTTTTTLRTVWARLVSAITRREQLLVVCAWCPGALAREYQRRWFDSDVVVSHGMCPECAAKMEAQFYDKGEQ